MFTPHIIFINVFVYDNILELQTDFYTKKKNVELLVSAKTEKRYNSYSRQSTCYGEIIKIYSYFGIYYLLYYLYCS